MDHCIGALGQQGTFDILFVAQIALYELCAGINGGLIAALEIVENDDFVYFVAEQFGGDTSNISGTAGN